MWNMYIKVVLVLLFAGSGIMNLFRAGQQREGKKLVDKNWITSAGVGLFALFMTLLLII